MHLDCRNCLNRARSSVTVSPLPFMGLMKTGSSRKIDTVINTSDQMSHDLRTDTLSTAHRSCPEKSRNKKKKIKINRYNLSPINDIITCATTNDSRWAILRIVWIEQRRLRRQRQLETSFCAHAPTERIKWMQCVWWNRCHFLGVEQ